MGIVFNAIVYMESLFSGKLYKYVSNEQSYLSQTGIDFVRYSLLITKILFQVEYLYYSTIDDPTHDMTEVDDSSLPEGADDTHMTRRRTVSPL